MTRAKACLYSVSLLSLVIVPACASTGKTSPAKSEAASEAARVEAAMAEKLAPATPQEIAEIERADALTRANFWAGEFRKDPTKLDVTISFTKVLREINSQDRAIEVLSKTIPLHPASDELQLIMGRALLSANRAGEAAEAFYKASMIAPGNAAAHAALGVALDRLERHHDAQTAYAAALDVDPNRTSTLTNYGLSLALSGDLSGAEVQLRRAAALPDADTRVRQNLALVLGLQGEFAEMRAIDPHAPKRMVEANLSTLKAMLAPTRDYGTLEPDDGPAPSPAPPEDTPEKPAPALRGSLSG